MFVADMAFFARISDPLIGGNEKSYFSLLMTWNLAESAKI